MLKVQKSCIHEVVEQHLCGEGIYSLTTGFLTYK